MRLFKIFFTLFFTTTLLFNSHNAFAQKSNDYELYVKIYNEPCYECIRDLTCIIHKFLQI